MIPNFFCPTGKVLEDQMGPNFLLESFQASWLCSSGAHTSIDHRSFIDCNFIRMHWTRMHWTVFNEYIWIEYECIAHKGWSSSSPWWWSWSSMWFYGKNCFRCNKLTFPSWLSDTPLNGFSQRTGSHHHPIRISNNRHLHHHHHVKASVLILCKLKRKFEEKKTLRSTILHCNA